MKRFLFILAVLTLASCITEYDLPPETWEELYVSPPDTIGNQVWMSDNMNYPVKDSKCDGKDRDNCERLYTWTGAMSVCPSGWHLPTKEELETLALTDSDFFSASSPGYWSYTADPEDPEKAYVFFVNSSKILEQKTDYKSTGYYSVRCIQNSSVLQSSSSGGSGVYSDEDFVGCVSETGACIRIPFGTCKLFLGVAKDECE